jgi:NADP-dependent 3-hydroxy acid dehydrogenase YdfG
LITDGGTAIGNGIRVAFVRASAKTLLIVGRSPDGLQKGANRLEEEAKTAGTDTKMILRELDLSDFAAVDAF